MAFFIDNHFVNYRFWTWSPLFFLRNVVSTYICTDNHFVIPWNLVTTSLLESSMMCSCVSYTSRITIIWLAGEPIFRTRQERLGINYFCARTKSHWFFFIEFIIFNNLWSWSPFIYVLIIILLSHEIWRQHHCLESFMMCTCASYTSRITMVWLAGELIFRTRQERLGINYFCARTKSHWFFSLSSLFSIICDLGLHFVIPWNLVTTSLLGSSMMCSCVSYTSRITIMGTYPIYKKFPYNHCANELTHFIKKSEKFTNVFLCYFIYI
jgi:hypothetical protein